MRILVTGASGFVGSHLIQLLRKKCPNVYGTYRQSKPAPEKGVAYIYCDFLNHKTVVQLLQKVKPTHVFHLVGQSSPSISWKKPYETIQGNVFSIIHLLEACRQLEMRPKILFASSAHVYGQMFHEKTRISEADLPKPMDPYATSKIQAEYFVLQYWYQFRIPSVIVRSSAHIGIRQAPFFSISNFSKQIAEIEKGKRDAILEVGNLKVERGFVAVEDMVRAYSLALQKGKPGEIYNIGAQSTKPMGEWLHKLLRLTKIKVKTCQTPERKRLKEPFTISLNSSKFRRLTGWRETISIDDTFRHILDWWRSRV